MTIYRSSGKNTEIYEEYELYTREYTENVQGKSSFTAKGGTTFGNKPETAKPLEITNLYVKVRLLENYDGEFGFDWVDVNPETKEIEKIQGVPFSEVEYFYKKGATSADLGDIVEKNTDEMGAKHAIQDHYKFSTMSKYVDMPYVMLKPNQEITLSAEIILWQGTINEDVVFITGDEYYEFEITGGEKEGKTAKKKLSQAGKIEFKVKCLQSATTDKIYEFKHSNTEKSSIAVGGITMMENKVLKLKFRVIALVSADNNPNEKAKALFRKFKDNDIIKYLNENSLNQAGYKVEIENFDAMDSADVDDYFYSFDKKDWEKKELFKVDHLKTKKHILISYSADGKEIKTETETKEVKEVVSEGTIDYKTVDFYNEKLKLKSKSYKGGIIILSEYESPSETAAFSRTSALNHYSLFMYSNGIETKEHYSHEIGHMLGLEHLFYHQKEKTSFINSKIYYTKLKDNKQDKINEKSNYYFQKETRGKKQTLIDSLKKFNTEYTSYITKKETTLNVAKSSNGNFTYDGKSVAKNQFISLIQEDIDKKKGYVANNKNALIQIDILLERDFDPFKPGFEFYLLKNDSIKIDDEFLKFYEKEWLQNINNYLRFKQNTTKNIMDYFNTKVFFLSHQIKIMRNDYENY